MEETLELTMEAMETPEVQEEPAMELACRELPEEELLEFVREHPDLDAATIPGHVWEAVKNGESLSRAYGRHEVQTLRENNRQLQEQLGLLHSQANSRQRSLGSMRSAGGVGAADSFLAGFNAE